MGHALVLNASFEPLHIVSWQRALQLLFQGKVEVIEESQQEVRTVRLTIRVPAVLRLLNYIPLTRKKQVIRFSRINVFIRDQYHELDTVLPYLRTWQDATARLAAVS